MRKFLIIILIILALIAGVIFVLKSDEADFKSSDLAPENSYFTENEKVNGLPENNLATSTNTEIHNAVSGDKLILFDVPFTAQAPFGNWEDDRQEHGCEEAVVLMAMRFVENRELTLEEAEREIIAISEYELKNYGNFHDTSAKDTVERILKGYFKYEKTEIRYNIGAEDIKEELKKGNLVITPVNGQKLGNPFYTPPGPIEHQILIIGYDSKTKEFITNDPGTKMGAGFRYKESILENALQDYPTGFKEPITDIIKAMIVVKPKYIL